MYSGTDTPLDPPPERFDLSFYDLDKGSRVYEVEEVVVGVDQITAYSAINDHTLRIAHGKEKVPRRGRARSAGCARSRRAGLFGNEMEKDFLPLWYNTNTHPLAWDQSGDASL